MQNNMQKFFSTLDSALKKAESDTVVTKQGGLVRSIKDGVMLIEGLDTLSMGEVITVGSDKTEAMVVQIGTEETYAVTLEPSSGIKVGQEVLRTGGVLNISASESLLGRVIDPLGRSLDGKGEIAGGTRMPLEAPAPSVMDRKPVSTPVATGIVAIDALIPIGRGQRELIIGDRQTGKTTIAIDTILNQKGQDMICVYVAVGQRDAKVAQVIKTLTDHKALDYTIVVNASASSPAMLQFLAPYAGVAAAEYFMKKGKDALVVYDDLSKHAVAYREISLLLRKPPGREAYPGDVFYIHSRLLERAARLSDEHGGGSITALPVIETQAGDISAYIPTNVISITDGQIFLEPSLFYRGVRPAINVGTSVSRVGSAAQTKIMKKISGTAKLDLAQYYELAAFSQFASELDKKSKEQLTRGSRLEEALKQKPESPRSLWQEAVILWLATKGYLDKVGQEKVSEKIASVLASVESAENRLIKQIEEKQELSDEVAKKLDAIAKKYVI